MFFTKCNSPHIFQKNMILGQVYVRVGLVCSCAATHARWLYGDNKGNVFLTHWTAQLSGTENFTLNLLSIMPRKQPQMILPFRIGFGKFMIDLCLKKLVSEKKIFRIQRQSLKEEPDLCQIHGRFMSKKTTFAVSKAQSQ